MMGTEAQKLITVSLEKIANCRRRRREMSLHKNLLVTTVIHKARLAIMEETYYMMSTYGSVDNSIHQHRGDDYHLQQQQQQPPPPSLDQQVSYYNNNNNEVPVECGGVPAPAAVPVVQDYVAYDSAPAPTLMETEEEDVDGRRFLPSHPHHYDLDQDVDHQPRPPDAPPTDAVPSAPPIITGPALSAALASTTLTMLTDCSGPVDWEGEHAMAVALRCGTEHGLCIRLEQVDVDDDDKENLSPVDSYSLSCCETNSASPLNKSASRSDPCGGATTTTTTTVTTNSAGSAFVSTTTTTTTTTAVAPRNGNAQKRTRGGACEDEVAKRCRWDCSSNTLCAELVVDCRGGDDSDDTSHALRLVSVLSASLGGGISTPSPQSSSSTTNGLSSGASCAGRLVRSNSTDLCSKQAKDNIELVGRSPVLAIAV